MKICRRFLAGAMILALAVNAATAQTQAAELKQAILDYKLTMPLANQLLSAIGPMTRYVASLPDLRERMAKTAKMTLAERISQLENDSKAMGILKPNNLTARDYIVGVPALRQAIWLAAGRPGANLTASPANLAFAKEHLAQLKPRMDAADGMPSQK